MNSRLNTEPSGLSPDSCGESRPRFNWGLVIRCVLMMALIHAQVMTFSGVFVAAVAEDLGITRAAFSMHITISLLVCIVVSSVIGRVYEKKNIRTIMLASSVLAAACSLSYSLAQNIVAFYITSLFMGCCGVTLGGTTVSIIINKSFPDETRGKAMGLAMAGSGLGGMLFTPIISSINTTIGWRWSFRLLAALILLLVTPMVAKNVKSEDRSREALSGKKTGPGIREIAGGKLFFFMLVLTCAFGFTCMILNNVGYVYFCEIGLTAAKASYCASVLAGFLIIGKLLVGAVADRYGNKVGVMGAVTLQMISYVLAIFSKQFSFLAVPTAIFYGLGNSLATVGLALFVSDVYGVENYGKVGGIMLSGLYLGNAIAPMVASGIYDNFGSYLMVMYISLALNIFMVAATYTVYRRKVRPQAKG